MNSAILKIVALLVLNSEVSVHDQRIIVIENVRSVMQQTKYIKEARITFKKTTNKSLKRKLKRHKCTCGIGFCLELLKKNSLTLVVDKPVAFFGDENAPFPVANWNYSCKRPEIDVFLDRLSSDLLREEITLFLDRCGR
jgi:hypothetical protein